MSYINGRRLMAQGRVWNVSTVKKYGDRYKLTQHLTSVKTAGLESDAEKGPAERAPPENNERLAASISRTRAAVYELAACNPWEYFSTWTLADDRGFDRYDLSPWYKDFSQWIRNQRRITGAPLAYLVVPECHKDGAWHLHGLWYGMPMDKLRELRLTDFLPYRLLDKLKDGRKLYSWTAYERKYGWCTLEPIRDRDRCASYIAKYITKAFAAAPASAEGEKEQMFSVASLPPGAKLYYASHGLKRAQLVWRGQLRLPPDFKWDFENEYVRTSWADTPIWLDARQIIELKQYEQGGFFTDEKS